MATSRNVNTYFDYIWVCVNLDQLDKPKYRVYGRDSDVDYDVVIDQGIPLGGSSSFIGVQKILDYWQREHFVQAVKWEDGIDLEARDAELRLALIRDYVSRQQGVGYL